MNSFLLTQSQRWDRITPSFSKLDSEPEQEILDFLNGKYGLLGNKGIDIGCGFGRHTLCAVKKGFEVVSVDFSQEAILRTNTLLAANGFRANTKLASMDKLIFDSETFDFNICWCVLNHGTRTIFEKAIFESFRLLKKNGYSVGLIMSREDSRFGNGDFVEKDCYMFDQGLEKGICHYFPSYDSLFQTLQHLGEVIEFKKIYASGEELPHYHPKLSRSAHIFYVVKK